MVDSDYHFSYPQRIILADGQTVELAVEDNQKRVLLVETTLKPEELRKVFINHRFKPTEGMEFEKDHQVGSGLFKSLTDVWDMHLRLLSLHEGFTAIDAEVEPSREYLEHLQSPTGNWASVIYEITNILQAVSAPIYLFYKRPQSYVANIITNWNLQLKKPQTLTEWKPVIIIIGLVAAGAIALSLLKK